MRKVVDSRDMPSETDCTLAITGEEDEAAPTPTEQATSPHIPENTAELRTQLRPNLRDEMPRHA
ncbi:hypothetical protein GCM10011583_27060 [Streptomyces camponoticapitis]|uniref:Uncharacterized protein n=1 Tax=Streptomyces camponoticapitis TaxID=1616125 RepID=A0ABQ2E6N2_9ACTN|nr:DUF1059 domain-containing protein [Streptomyces camponoticapitis]GGJ94200.1 hypothetical protein GCM10011583_27060 [Streptomyces camponoticapitis]